MNLMSVAVVASDSEKGFKKGFKKSLRRGSWKNTKRHVKLPYTASSIVANGVYGSLCIQNFPNPDQ